MAGRNFLPAVGRLTSDIVNTRVGGALLAAIGRTGMSQTALAERLGKEDRKTAADLIAGKSKLDIVAFLAAIADPDLGDEFGNEVLRLVNRQLAPCDVQAAPVDALACDLSGFLAALLKAWSDQKLTHVEKSKLAKLLRPLMPKLQAVITAADAH